MLAYFKNAASLTKWSILSLMLLSLVFIGSCKNYLDHTLLISQSEVLNIEPSVDSIQVEGYKKTSSIPTVENLTISRGLYSDRVELSWKPVFSNEYIEGFKYLVFRSSDGTEWGRVTESPISTVLYCDMANSEDGNIVFLESGKIYYYVVVAVYETQNLHGVFSEIKTGSILGIPSKPIVSLREYADKITVNWNPVEGAEFYRIYRAEALDEEGTAPPPENYTLIQRTFSKPGYIDRIKAMGGSLDSDKLYFYTIQACASHTQQSKRGPISEGQCLVLGAPSEIELVRVSNQAFNNAVRIEWVGSSLATSYQIYRGTRVNFNNGVRVGDRIEVDTECQISSAGGNIIYYDTDIELGVEYFYRISGVNEIGAGQLSSLRTEEDVTKAFGSVLAGIDSFVSFRAPEFIPLEWTCLTLPENYNFLIYRSEEETPTTWGASIASIAELSFRDVMGGSFDYENTDLYYRFEVLNLDLVSSQGDPNATATDYINEISGIQSNFGKLVNTTVGKTPLSETFIAKAAPPIILPVEIAASQKDVDYVGSIAVTGKIPDFDLIKDRLDEVDFQLIRTCRYGEDNEVDAQAEPAYDAFDAGYQYSEWLTTPVRENVEILSFNNSIAEDGTFTFIDPMHDFDGDGNVKGTLHWDYSTWDREAWKDIKRKNGLDLDRACKVDYRIKVLRSHYPDWNPAETSESVTGWPELTMHDLAHLGFFLRECAFNRLWHLEWAGYHWKVGTNTVIYALTHGQDKVGQVSGVIDFTAKVNLNPMGGTGTGHIQEYADWPGFSISVDAPENKFTVQIALNEVAYMDFPLSFSTPLYNGKVLMHIGIFNGLYQLGVGILAESQDVSVGSYVEVTRDSGEVERFEYKKSNPFSFICNEYRGKDPDAWSSMVNGYTRINSRYRIPDWPKAGHTTNWTCNYAYNYDSDATSTP